MPLPTYSRTNTGDPEALAKVEWLLTSGTGGFAMGTALGAPSRRYHGLLVAALRPPVKRVMALAHVAELVSIDPGSGSEQRFDLATFRFRPGALHPRGDSHLVRFEKDSTVRWFYQAGPVAVTKTVQLLREAPAVAIRYTARWTGPGPARPIRLSLRPLVALRDFHALILRDTARDRFRSEPLAAACNVHTSLASLFMACDGARFEPAEQWWFDFQLETERDRGYDFLEDLYNPGSFTADIPAAAGEATITLYASTQPGPARDLRADADAKQRRLHDMIRTTRELMRLKPADDRPEISALVSAADDFVVKRIAPSRLSDPAATPDIYTIIAGYPWFADWGRDSMIALPGLLLATGRYHEAGDVLTTFATSCKAGLIPNVFDDYTGQPHYNTVDASLWFIHACTQHLRATGDSKTFTREFLPACLDILSAYRAGTLFHIKVDPADGLITAGDETTQLTWMDAKRDGVVFTPRHGKPVEINALWYNALRSISKIIAPTHPDLSAEFTRLADKVALSFKAQYWDAGRSCLIDCLFPPATPGGKWAPATEIRPNQVFAASLPHSPLDAQQKTAVVRTLRATLLTPHGVRTLEPGDQKYRGRYRGRMFDRDAAYHNGTAWPWLLGPLAEATLRAGAGSPESVAQAKAILEPITRFLGDDGCLGQLPEIFDGDDTQSEPQKPNGCPAQAWSVAEVLRVHALIARVEGGEKEW
ncbi:MAG: amylo-alpha-1,6-glucosidase [Phycisphaerales bacterium]